MRTRVVILLVVICLCGSARAGLVHFFTAPNADQEVHDVNSAGTGAGWLLLDPDTNMLDWSIIYNNMTGSLTAVHIYGPAEPGENAAAIITLDHTINPIVGSTTITEAQAADLLADLWYVNFHTEAYPAGEIRGQIIKVIPEPATVMLLGLGALALLRKRR